MGGCHAKLSRRGSHGERPLLFVYWLQRVEQG